MRETTTGGGPYFTCPNCKAQYPQGCVHHCQTTVNVTANPITFTQPDVSSMRGGDELLAEAREQVSEHQPDPAWETMPGSKVCLSCGRRWPCQSRVFADAVVAHLEADDRIPNAERDEATLRARMLMRGIGDA